MLIVVARYNENIEWTNQFQNVLIYNKGEQLEKEYNEIKLDNVGREGHTYYKYIYENYDKLEDYTIFLQGNPFDHCPNIIQNLNNLVNDKDKLDIKFEFLTERIFYCTLEGCCNHPGLPLKDVYEKLFDKKIDNLGFLFGAGAQFIVSKTSILKNSKEFYMKIIELLQNDICPIEGYVIERFHSLIFGKNSFIL
jgi:hypothetical protein